MLKLVKCTGRIHITDIQYEISMNSKILLLHCCIFWPAFWVLPTQNAGRNLLFNIFGAKKLSHLGLSHQIDEGWLNILLSKHFPRTSIEAIKRPPTRYTKYHHSTSRSHKDIFAFCFESVEAWFQPLLANQVI